MANTKRKLKDYMGFSITVADGYKYEAVKEGAPPLEKRDRCLTIRANDLKSLKKMVRIYTETGEVRKLKDLTSDPDAWIIAVCNTEADGIVIRKAFGNEEKIRKILVGMLLEDKENDIGAYDYGTEMPDEVEKDLDVLNASATYSDYHIDYTAMRVMDIRSVTD